MKNAVKKCLSLVLTVAVLMSVMVFATDLGTQKASAASWNGTNYGGGKLYGSRTFLDAFGIDYDVYMKWMDDHDADSDNPNYYLGTPYAHNDHRNPRGDCSGAYGAYDSSGVAAMNCTGFVWHVLYKSAVMSGASSYQINRLQVMWRVPVSWSDLGIYRIYFNSIEDAYDSGVLEKGDLMWIYGSSDNHNAIFYGDSPEDFIYWDSAGERNRYAEVHSIGNCLGLWVAKVTRPNEIELQMDAPVTGTNGSGKSYGAKYCIFNSYSDAKAVVNNPDNMDAWDERVGTVVLDSSGHGCLREGAAPNATQLWVNGSPVRNQSYFNRDARRVDSRYNYYAVQWSAPLGEEVNNLQVLSFSDSGERTPSGYRVFTAKIPKSVATPKFTQIKSTSDGIQLTWSKVKNADAYRIYYLNRNNDWVRLKETKSTTFTDTDVKDGQAFIYTIRCIDSDGDFISSFNSGGWKFRYDKLDTPTVTSHQTTPDGILLEWNAVEGADRYRVYYKNSRGGWNRLTETTSTSYLDETFNVGSTYTYTVRCVDSDGDFTSDFNKSGWKHTYEGLTAPEITELTPQADGVRVSIEPVEGAAYYCIYHKTSKGWQRIAKITDTEYLDTLVDSGESYTYTVRCMNEKGSFNSDFNRSGWSCTYSGVDTPKISEIYSEENGVRLSWKPVEGAVRYRVYCQKRTGGWARIAEITDTTFLDEVVYAGKSYTYTVRAVNENGYFMSDFDRSGSTCTFEPPAPIEPTEPTEPAAPTEPAEVVTPTEP